MMRSQSHAHTAMRVCVYKQASYFYFSVSERFRVNVLIFNEIAEKCRRVQLEYEVIKTVGKEDNPNEPMSRFTYSVGFI